MKKPSPGPALAQQPLIAQATWGFGQTAHFARVYRQHYGIPPSVTLAG